MQFNTIRSSAMPSAAPAPQQEKVQSVKGDPTVLKQATSDFAKKSQNAFRAVQNAFGSRAEAMLALTANAA
jgi:hypothetical protein